MTKKILEGCVFIAISLLTAMPIMGQKKELDHSVYDTWKNLASISISDDGQYAASIVKEQEGDSYLLLKNLQTMEELIVPRVYKYNITPNNRQIIGLISAPFADTRRAKINKTAEEKMPKDSLLIIELDKFSVTKIANISNYKMGKDTTSYFAYTISDTLKHKDKKLPKTQSVVIRHLDSLRGDTIAYVTDYIFSKNGRSMAIATMQPVKDSVTKTSVVFLDLDSYQKGVILEGKNIYKHLSLSESGEHLSFIASSDSLKAEIKDYALYYYGKGDKLAQELVTKTHANMPKNWTVSEYYVPRFSKSGKRLLLGTAEIQQAKDTTIPDFEKPALDLWHWNEPQIQPMQWAELKKDLERTYLAYIDLSNKSKLIQLGTKEIPDIHMTNEGDGKYAIGLSRLPYLYKIQWDMPARTTYDVWTFDLEKGTHQKIKTELIAKYNISPQGEYFSWYDIHEKQYYTYSLETAKEFCLTDKLGVNLWDEEHDTPSFPEPYGYMAWEESDKALLIYDKYDVWKLDPMGKRSPQNLTNGEGRKKEVSLRYIKTDLESRFVKPGENILFSAFDNLTKEHGFYKMSGGNLHKLSIDKYSYTNLVKAKNKDMYLYRWVLIFHFLRF